MAIVSKYSTGEGWEARGFVQCKITSKGASTPGIAVDNGSGSTFSFDANNGAVVLLPIADANRMRADNQVDF